MSSLTQKHEFSIPGNGEDSRKKDNGLSMSLQYAVELKNWRLAQLYRENYAQSAQCITIELDYRGIPSGTTSQI